MQRVIGPRVLENYTFLKKIATSKSTKRRLSLLRNASTDELLCLVEVASNLLKKDSKFPLTERHKNKLTPHIDYLRKLARIRSEKGARRIVQEGNGLFFPSLLIPIIGEAARLLLTNNKKGVIEDN
jgi:hypothetical protein